MRAAAGSEPNAPLYARTAVKSPAMPRRLTETMKSPDLLADAAKQKLDISPSTGAEVEAEMKRMASISEEIKKEVREAIGN